MNRKLFIMTLVVATAVMGGACKKKQAVNPESSEAAGEAFGEFQAMLADIPVQLPEASTHVQELYQEWLDGTDSPRVQEALHTAYQGPGQPADSRDIKW